MTLAFQHADAPTSEIGSEDELLPQVVKPSCSVRRVLFASFGALAVIGCLSMAAFLQSGRTKESGAVSSDGSSARMLLRSSDFADVATDNIMEVARKLYKSSDRPRVRALVDSSILQVDLHLGNNPTLSGQLDALKLSQEQQRAVLQSARYITDPRVQNIGLKVAHAVRSCQTENPSDVKRHVLKEMLPYLNEVERLNREVFPAYQLHTHKAGSRQGWDTDFNPERVRLLKTFDDKWDAHLHAAIQGRSHHAALRKLQVFSSTTNAPMVKSEEALGIMMAVMDQARALIDIMRPMAKVFGNDLNMNVWATSGIGASSALFHLVSCVLDGVVDGYNLVEIASCPVQIGSEGMDAIRGLLAEFGILGDNNPKNGVTGNHNGEEESENVGKETSQDILNR